MLPWKTSVLQIVIETVSEGSMEVFQVMSLRGIYFVAVGKKSWMRFLSGSFFLYFMFYFYFLYFLDC